MTTHFCVWDYQDDYRHEPTPCDEPASVRVRGEWFCEKHADAAERLYNDDPNDGTAETRLENMGDL